MPDRSIKPHWQRAESFLNGCALGWIQRSSHAADAVAGVKVFDVSGAEPVFLYSFRS
jgi:hypothetical protein